MKKSLVAIIIPAYNEAEVIKETLQKIKDELQKSSLNFKLVVVNDGSTDKTKEISEGLADVVLNHRVNRGLGAALATGIEYTKRKGKFDYLVTFDSDGQHNPKDIIRALSKLKSGSDVVIGSRFKDTAQQFPKLRKYILQFSNIITYLFFHVWTTDSQSGFRALNKNALNSIKLVTNRMEVSSEFFSEIKKHGLVLSEIPITIKYTPYSMKKGQSNLNSFKILVKLLYKVFH